MTFTLTIRPRRQTTLPQLLLQEVGLAVGDSLVAEVDNKKIVLKPQKQVSIDAFKAIQKAFQESGIPESDFQEAIKKDREAYARKNYPRLYRH